MKKRIIAVSLALMSLCLSANADVVQTLTINGQTVEKTVTQLTFSGDNVVLYFEGSEESYALDDVVLDFSDVSSINSINTFKLNGLVDHTGQCREFPFGSLHPEGWHADREICKTLKPSLRNEKVTINTHSIPVHAVRQCFSTDKE